jgi:hypothetical protein
MGQEMLEAVHLLEGEHVGLERGEFRDEHLLTVSPSKTI